MKLRILLTGAGAPGMNGILKCFRSVRESEIYLVGVDADPNAPTRKEFDSFYPGKKADDEGFIDCLLEICRKERIDIIMPCVTRELEKLAAQKKLFRNYGVTVAVQDTKQLEISNDKGLLLDRMLQADMRVPVFYLANNWDQLERAIHEIGYPHKGFCIKAVRGNGSRTVRIVDTHLDKRRMYYDEKPNGLYCSLNDLEDILKEDGFYPVPFMIMQLLNGEEYSVDLVCREGNTLAAVVRKALSVVSSNQTGSVVVDRPDLVEYCTGVVSELCLSGNIGFDIKCDEDGTAYIIECNPRLTGGIVTCLAAGANMPWLGVKSWMDLEVGQPCVKYGVKMQRYWQERFYDQYDSEIII